MIKFPVKYLPYFSCLVAALLWSSSFVALKLAFRAYDPMVVIFGRLFLASLLFLLFIHYFKGVKFRKQDIKYLILMAICEPCLFFIFEAKALEFTSASQAGMVTSILPLMVAFLAWLFLKERITAKTISGFLVAIVGVCVLSAGSEVTPNAPNAILGNFLELVAMVMAASYTIILKRLSAHYPSLFLASMQAFIGTVFYFPFLFLPETVLPNQLIWVPTIAVIFLGIFVTFGAYATFNYGISLIPANQATAFINLIPVFAVIQGYLILNDQLNSIQGIAIILVIIGVLISQQSPIKKEAI